MGFLTIGRGVGGIDELQTHLDDGKVVWGLVRVTVGSGSMARQKFVFLYFSGSACPMVKRMRYTERRPAAVSALGGGGMIDWDREHKDDVTMDTMLENLLKSVVSDDAGAATSVASLRADAMAEIKAATEALKVAKPKPRVKKPKPVARVRSSAEGGVGGATGRTALALRADFQVAEAVNMVCSPTGALNWVLVTPGLKLVEAGGGSIPEMAQFLNPDKVIFGVVRMGFGSERWRRNHYLFVHWAGESCKHLARGKGNAEKLAVKAALLKGGDAIELFAQAADEADLQACIAKLTRFILVDGDSTKQSTSDPAGAISVEAFNEALKEDNVALAAEFGISAELDAELEPAPELDDVAEAVDGLELSLTVAEAVDSVRGDDEPFNWVLIGPSK